MKSVKILTISTLLTMSNIVTAQKVEINGKHNTYIQKETSGLYGVWNKKSTLLDTTPSYLYFEHIPHITIKNKNTLDTLVHNYISPFFKSYKGKLKSTSILYFYFYADINGRIKEIYISYPKEIGTIPILKIEELEYKILNSDIKLIFDKNNRVFKGSAWVGQYAAYNAEKLRSGE